MRAVGIALFAAFTLSSATLAQREGAAARRDRVIESLVSETRSVPPEFAADVLLQLAGSPRVADQAWRRDLIEEAYLRAYSAGDSYRVTATAGATPNNRQGAQVIASDTALTRVSLQTRAAQLMVTVDPRRAREMFDWIDLNLSSGGCDSPLVPSVDEYYTTLAVLARQAFGADVQSRGDALRFMTLYLFHAHLPTEMPAVANALRTFRPTADEAQFLEGTFRWILESSLRDPRGFSSVSIDLVTQLMALEDADRALGLNNWNVTRALRDYLVTQFKDKRCSDSLTDATAVDTFNAALKRRDIAPETIKPLAPGETRPSGLLGAARLDPYWRALDARRLYEMGLRLRGPDNRPVSDEKRRSEEWLSEAERLLTGLERWSGSREMLDRDFFYQKAVLYTLLVDLVPPTPLRTRTLRSFAEYLKNSDRERDSRLLWFAFARRLIELTRSADRPVVIDVLEQSGNTVLALYGHLARTVEPGRRPSHF